MRFDVRPILHAPGKRLTFQFSLDLSDVEFAGRHPISRPVEVEDIRRSNRLLYATAILGAVIFILIGSAVRYCFFL